MARKDRSTEIEATSTRLIAPGKAIETLAASNSHVGTGALPRAAERSSAVLRSRSLRLNPNGRVAHTSRPVRCVGCGNVSATFATVRQAPIWGTANRISTLWGLWPREGERNSGREQFPRRDERPRRSGRAELGSSSLAIAEIESIDGS
jgi:hypothetical protein